MSNVHRPAGRLTKFPAMAALTKRLAATCPGYRLVPPSSAAVKAKPARADRPGRFDHLAGATLSFEPAPATTSSKPKVEQRKVGDLPEGMTPASLVESAWRAQPRLFAGPGKM